MKKAVLLSAFGLILLASCTSDISDNTIEYRVDNQVAMALNGRAATQMTRSTSNLPEGLQIGVYCYLKDSSITTASYQNRPYTSQEDGSLTSPDTILLKVQKDYQCSTYAPYLSNVSSSSELIFPIATDVLWSPTQVLLNVSQSNRSVELAFEHCAAQISFNVSFDDAFVGDKTFTEASTLTVSGFYPTSRLNLLSGVLTPEETPTSSLNGVLTGAGSTDSLSIPPTCFAPSLDKMPLNITITHGGKTYSGNINKVFVAGTSYVYSLLIGTQNSSLGLTGTLQDWVSQSETISIK